MVHGEDFGAVDLDTMFPVEAIALSLQSCLVVQGRWTNLVSIFIHSAQCGHDHLHREYRKCPKSLALSSLTEGRKLLIFIDGRPAHLMLCLGRILVVQWRLCR